MRSEAEVRQAVEDLLSLDTDLAQWSVSKVVKALSDTFGEDMRAQKATVKAIVKARTEEILALKEGHEEEAGNGAVEDGAEAVVEAVEAPKKEEEAQQHHPNDGANGDAPDAKPKPKPKPQPQAQPKAEDEGAAGVVQNGYVRRRAAVKADQKSKRQAGVVIRPKAKPAQASGGESGEGDADGDADDKKKKSAPKLHKPMRLSEKLADFMGKDKETRPEVWKTILAYIKDKDLQDPKNRKQIVFDDKLAAVFGRKRSDFFKIQKLITAHLYRDD